jgi:hypothetical protein
MASCCCCTAALSIELLLGISLLLLLLLLLFGGGTIHSTLCTAAVCADHLSSWLPLLLSTSTQLPSAQPASTCDTASRAHPLLSRTACAPTLLSALEKACNQASMWALQNMLQPLQVGT